MKDYFCVPRRYNFQIPIFNETELSGITKSAQLNITIKKLLAITLSGVNDGETTNLSMITPDNESSLTLSLYKKDISV